jgi:tetratricopeptide (TPR) repeat protein
MIVKNESNIIVRLLESVVKFIDCYCICDTGSTDDTINIIRNYFEEQNIPGTVIEEPFRDFGHNRTYALRGCHTMPDVDYILLLDADMKLEIKSDNIDQVKMGLTKDAYYVVQGSPNFYNENIRIVRNDPTYHYWGVTHEYIDLPNDATMDRIGRDVLFITDIGDGSNKENKYHRDIELLTRGLETTPNNPRYLFYLANSYRDSGQYENAIEIYKKRIEVGGWIQETWHSYYSVGNCYMHLGQIANAVYYWLESYQFMPTRIENLYQLITHYRGSKKYALALVFYEIAAKIRNENPPNNHLFLENDIYEHKLDYEYSIIGYYTKIHKSNMIKTCMSLLNKRNIRKPIYTNIIANYKYYCKALCSISITPESMKSSHSSLLNRLNDIGKELIGPDTNMYPSTPSICGNPGNTDEIYVCKRYVNYTIGDDGKYINQEKVITQNVFAKVVMENNEWTTVYEHIMDYNCQYDDMYVGCEDVKLYLPANKYPDSNHIEYISNRVLPDMQFKIEHGVYDCLTNTTVSSSILDINPSLQPCEKNWTCFQTLNCEDRIVYKWSPLTICEKTDGHIKILHNIETSPIFTHLRGSSNGIHVGNEIWFIGHIVSYEDKRYYYHMFVAINAITFEPAKYSELFTFENEPVEYSLGFIYRKEDNKIWIGYSTNDNSSKYMLLDKARVDEMWITCE